MFTKNPKSTLCTLKRGNPLKNKKVMESLNPALAEDSTTREKKRTEWRKSLDTKLKKLQALSDKRKEALWKELKSLK